MLLQFDSLVHPGEPNPISWRACKLEEAMIHEEEAWDDKSVGNQQYETWPNGMHLTFKYCETTSVQMII